MACGVVPVTFPIEGMSALLGDLAEPLIADAATPEAAALKVVAVLQGNIADLRRRAYERSNDFGYPRAAERLIEAYERLTTSSTPHAPGSHPPL
jgi:glycosyltransferase involved in cell wall biosynthesis